MQRHEKVAERAGSLVTERVRALLETAEARAERVRREAADEVHRLDSRRMDAASRIVSQIGELEGTLGRLRQQMQGEHVVEGSYVDEGRLIEAVQEREVDAPAAPTASTGPSATVPDAVEEPPAVEEAPSPGEEQDPSPEEVEELAAEVQELAAEVKELKAEVQERTAEVEGLRAEPEEPAVDSDAETAEAAVEPEPEPEHAPEPEPPAQDPEPSQETRQSEAPTPVQDEPPSQEGDTEELAATSPAATEEATDDAQGSRFSFRRRRGAPEETGPAGGLGAHEPVTDQATQEAYACGVCGRGFAGNEDELKSLGWVMSESGAITCADCHSAGWLPPGS